MRISQTKEFNIPTKFFYRIEKFLDKNAVTFLLVILSAISVIAFYVYYENSLGLAYNDARSHLDIGRRVVEGLKPGIAQLGSVWLPLPHILMVFTIWNDFMWHSGLAGALISMISFVATGIIIYKYLEELNVGLLGRFFGVLIFVANINILYLQSTAMTELLLLATMTIGSYYLMLWYKSSKLIYLLLSSFWIMLSTLTRYDGWFLLFWASLVLLLNMLSFKNFRSSLRSNYHQIEGKMVLYITLGSFGILLWFLWNLIIFKNPLYFAFGEFSAKFQQDQLEAAGVLQTKHDLWLSLKFYLYALMYNSNVFVVLLGLVGSIVFWFDKTIKPKIRIASTALVAPLFFNVLALYLGHSVLFIQGLSGDTWFNVRYGIMLMPSIAIFIGYCVHKVKDMRYVIMTLSLLVLFFSFASQDAVTIDDARVGSSQKNVSEVAGWLSSNAANEQGFVLISAASHDAIIFSSGMPMKRFIHEGTGLYWESAVEAPDRWARWIIMRTYDENDLTYREISDANWEDKYILVDHFPFADIYELKPEYTDRLNTQDSIDRKLNR